jgi:hypothetical protein
MKTKINAQIVAHSVNEQGDELISVLATFPRIILAEVNTHRMLSKNTSSSRAIPFAKMVETIQNDPFIPIAWQKEHKGMQGTEYFTDSIDLAAIRANWLLARDRAVSSACWLNEGKLTKQLCNRLLEPFMWTTMLITGPKSGWDNFFNLRCPKYEINCGPEDTDDSTLCTGKSWKDFMSDKEGLAGDFDTDNVVNRLLLNKGQAEIHMMALAEAMWDAINESTPKELKAGEWHIPFGDHITNVSSVYKGSGYNPENPTPDEYYFKELDAITIKIATARCARVSYTVVGEEGKEANYETMINLHDRLLAWDPPHSSPLEHCCKALTEEEYYQAVKGCRFNTNELDNSNYGWVNNIKGFMPYRYIIDNCLTL